MSKRLVIALGSLPADEIQAELGGDFLFVAHPSEADFANAEGAILRAEFHLNAEALERLKNLKVAARTGVGVDRVDLEAARKRGVAILITPGANSNAVAEGTMAQLLHLSKRLGEMTELVRESRWSERESYALGDLEGANLGLIGYGRIGRRVAEMAQAFGMRVLAFDPLTDVPESHRVESLEELLTQSGYLSVHVPLTDQTRNLIGAKELNLMPLGSILVNCSRGGIVNLDAAYDALVSGKLGGLGLDSFDPEPAEHHRVFYLPNVVLTPHVMGLSQRAKRQTFLAAAAGVRNFLQGSKDYFVVNGQLEGK